VAKELEPTKGGELITTDVMAEMEAATLEEKALIDLTSDVRLPQIRLVQATTQDVTANPGQLIDTLTGEAADALTVVPLSMFKTRAFFGFGGAIGDPPQCTSADAIIGHGEPGGECARCPHADWRNGGRCQLRYNYMMMAVGDGYNPETEIPRGVMMHGTSAKVATRLNTMLLGGKYMWSNVIRLSSTSEKNDRGTYKVWEAKKERACTDEEILVAFNWYKQIKAARSVQIAPETPVEAVTPPSDDDVPF
jgi:hypothetical protein